ncbi:hypothetical protein, partial [Streptomyces xiaopingdaonensis]|uniref:hypothetical protein n=1 Tax=Streptomyces xiaopingdaonensis TaxID=1565415 RepID=UPI001ED8E4C8
GLGDAGVEVLDEGVEIGCFDRCGHGCPFRWKDLLGCRTAACPPRPDGRDARPSIRPRWRKAVAGRDGEVQQTMTVQTTMVQTPLHPLLSPPPSV